MQRRHRKLTAARCVQGFIGKGKEAVEHLRQHARPLGLAWAALHCSRWSCGGLFQQPLERRDWYEQLPPDSDRRDFAPSCGFVCGAAADAEIFPAGGWDGQDIRRLDSACLVGHLRISNLVGRANIAPTLFLNELPLDRPHLNTL